MSHLNVFKSTLQKNTKGLLSKAFLNVKVKCWIWFQLVMVKLVWSSLFLRVVWLDTQLSSCQWLVVTVSWTILLINTCHWFQVKLVDVTVVPLFLSMLVRLQLTQSCLSKNVVRSLSTQVLRFMKEWSSVKTLVKMTWQLTSLRQNKWPTSVQLLRTKQLLSRPLVSWPLKSLLSSWTTMSTWK